MEFFSDEKYSDYYKYSRNEMLDFIPDSCKKVLEIGCAEGLFGEKLKQVRDVEIWGVELFPDAGIKAKKRLEKVIIGDIESDSIDLPSYYFDCVIFNDVLEHFKNPWNVLNKLKKNLKKDAYVVASIPNVRYYNNLKSLLINKNWQYENSGVLDFGHLRFFTKKSIIKMFTDCGYYVINIKGINSINLSWKLKLIKPVFYILFSDTFFRQFACIAQIKQGI